MGRSNNASHTKFNSNLEIAIKEHFWAAGPIQLITTDSSLEMSSHLLLEVGEFVIFIFPTSRLKGVCLKASATLLIIIIGSFDG